MRDTNRRFNPNSKSDSFGIKTPLDKLLLIFISLLFLSLFAGCTSDKEILKRSKSLCSCHGGLWYTKHAYAHCNDGTDFFNVDELKIYTQNLCD